MSVDSLSLKPLKDAAASLEDALKRHVDDLTRDGVIQRFEYTFELSWKTLKRYFTLNNNLKEDNVKNLFREAGKQGLIDSVERWFSYHKARNLTSHTYSEKIANEVFSVCKDFSTDVGLLIDRLENLID